MPGPEAVERPDPYEEFVADLRGLRQRAGNPSFRRMAAKSGAVSHATLHLTVTGHRLQPWETVREFVRACDGDEDEWHARWTRTERALCPPEAPTADDPPGRRPRWRSRRVLVPAGVLAVVVAAGAAGAAAALRPDAHRPAGRAMANANPHAMVYKGDASRFIRDITYPDGTVVKPEAQFVKVWEIRNSGSVEWRNRYLQRIDLPERPGDCATPERIPVNHTFPRENVQITVTVRAPSRAPAHCKVRWKMVDAAGRVLMPAYRPLFFDVEVRN